MKTKELLKMIAYSTKEDGSIDVNGFLQSFIFANEKDLDLLSIEQIASENLLAYEAGVADEKAEAAYAAARVAEAKEAAEAARTK